jgi:hypothetical protein
VHLVRLVIGLVLRAAQWCAGRLPRQQRMLLATLVLGVDQEPPPAVAERSGENWREAADALRQGTLLLRQLPRTVRAVAEPCLDTHDLCEAIRDLGRQVDDAANVLGEVETGAPADAATLDGVVFPSWALLRLARQRAELRLPEEAMARREDAVSGPGAVWEASWEADGSVSARSQTGLLVRGWAACPQAVAQVVAPWEASSDNRPRVRLTSSDTSPDVPAPWGEGAPVTARDLAEAFNAGGRQLRELAGA